MPPTRLMSLQDWETLAVQSSFQPALMAARCPLSLRQLERCFAAQFGKTPRQWTRELRCRLACPLVIQGWSNRAVAIELGFADEAHFCHDFKRVYGVPPQKFARAQGAPPPRSGPPVPCSPLVGLQASWSSPMSLLDKNRPLPIAASLGYSASVPRKSANAKV